MVAFGVSIRSGRALFFCLLQVLYVNFLFIWKINFTSMKKETLYIILGVAAVGGLVWYISSKNSYGPNKNQLTAMQLANQQLALRNAANASNNALTAAEVGAGAAVVSSALDLLSNSSD